MSGVQMSDFISKIGHLDPRLYSLIYCDTGGPDVGGPDVGGPDVGGPDVGGPDVGGPDVGGPDIRFPYIAIAKIIFRKYRSILIARIVFCHFHLQITII